jgi:hypothetical protein
MKKILIIIIMILSFGSFSQDFPRLEVDSLGRKYVVISYEQAQKVDNTFELVALLEKAGHECDSTVLSYIRVVDGLEKLVGELEYNLTLNKGQLVDKDGQILNLSERLKNSDNDSKLCNDQLLTRDSQINLLKDEIKDLKTKRNIAYGTGVLGIIIGVLVAIVTN